MAKEEQIKSRIVLDGEKEYKKSCREINASLREIGSELKLVGAEFASNANSTDALKKKQEVLKKQFAEQTKKVEEAEKALTRMRESGIEPTDPAYRRMQTNLNNAKTEMKNTENQIKSMDVSLKKTTINWNGVGSVVKKTGKVFGKALAGLGAAAMAAASALAGATVSASNYADDVMTMATNTHIAAEDLQKYQYALNFIDGDINTLTKTMRKNTQVMNTARNGSKLVQDAYRKIGVSVTDANGDLRDGQTVYWEVIDALGAVENQTERDALAMMLLGRSGTEVNTIIDAGSEAFKKMGDEAEAMGVVMIGDALNALGQFNDKLQVLKAGMGGLKNSAALIALPFMDELAAKGIPILADFSTGIQQAGGDISKISGVIGQGLSGIVNTIIQELPKFVSIGIQMISALVEGILINAPQTATAAVNIVKILVDGISQLAPLVIDGASQIVSSLAIGIAQAAPNLLPSIIDVVAGIANSLIENIPLLINAALILVQGLAQGILDAVPVLIDALPGIVINIVDALLAAIPQIAQTGVELITSIVNAMPLIIETVVGALPNLINGIINSLMNNIPLIIQSGFELFTSLVTNLPMIQAQIITAIPLIIGGIQGAIIGNIPKIVVTGVKLFVSLVKNMPKIMAGLLSTVPKIIGGIIGAFKNHVIQFVRIGENLLQGIWNGIKGTANWLFDKIKTWAGDLVDKVKKLFGIHSPSKVFAQIGQFMAKGLGIGFSGEMNSVSKSITDALQYATDDAVKHAKKRVTGIPSIVNKKISSAFTRNKNRVHVQDNNQIGKGYIRNTTDGQVVQITQNIYANNTSYVDQQREAARRFRQIAREVMA